MIAAIPLAWSWEFDPAVAAFFRHPAEPVMGCETPWKASERFTRTVAVVISRYAEQRILTHGTVLSLFVARATGMEPFTLWKQLGLPSFVGLRFPPLELVRVVEKLTAAQPCPADGL